MKLSFRPLTEDEVQFTVKVEEETDCPVKGSFASGDDDIDAQTEKEILDRLRRGDSYAWCCVIVEATWEGYRAFDSLGACCLSGETDVESTVKDHCMRENALDCLNKNIQSILDNISKRVSECLTN